MKAQFFITHTELVDFVNSQDPSITFVALVSVPGGLLLFYNPGS